MARYVITDARVRIMEARTIRWLLVVANTYYIVHYN